MTVADLLTQDYNQWNWQTGRQILPHLENKIRLITPSSLKKPDKLAWLPTKNGIYSTKSGYVVARMEIEKPPTLDFINWSSHIWKLPTIPKI